MVSLIRRASPAADVIHFPEGALSGYAGQQIDSWQGYDWSALEAGHQRIAAACREGSTWAVYGTAHSATEGRLPNNSVVVVAPDGERAARYDKRCCSQRELRYFDSGGDPMVVEIAGMRCGFLLCLEWSFPQLWQAYAEVGVELLFLSSYAAGLAGKHLHGDVVPPTLQGYAFTNSLFISASNACNPQQAFASHWVKRSGRRGAACRRHRRGFILNAIADDPDKDAFYAMVRRFRRDAMVRLET
jgi:predicted amidohydrolase